MKKMKLIFVAVLIVVTIGLLVMSMWPSIKIDVRLPEPNLDGKYTAQSVIKNQSTSDELSLKEVSLKEISQVLWGMQGITHGKGSRTAPSAMGISPMELYVIHGGTSDLEAGFYKYSPEYNSLEKVSTVAELPDNLIEENPELMSSLNNIKTSILIAGTYDQVVAMLGEFATFFVDLEVGHIVGNGILQLNAINSATQPIYNFKQDELKEYFGISEIPFVVLPIGTPRTPLSVEKVVETKSKSFEKALQNRRSTRNYLEGSVKFEDVAEIIESSFDNSALEKCVENLEIFLISSNVDGLDSGLYAVNLDLDTNLSKSSLELLDGNFQISKLQETIMFDGGAITKGQAVVVVSIKQDYLNSIGWDPVLFRIQGHLTGNAVQNFLIKCSELGLGTVSVGGFNPPDVAAAIDKTGEIHPVYTLPIGITPEYAGGKPIVEISNLGRVLGYFGFGIFFLLLFGTLIPVRKILKKNHKILHICFGAISVALMNMHYMSLHGLASKLVDFINPILHLKVITHLFQHSLKIPKGIADVGLFTASLAFLFMLLTLIFGIFIAMKSFKKKKLARILHNISLIAVVILMVVHIFFNNVAFSNNPNVFLLLSALIIEVYFLVLIASKNIS